MFGALRKLAQARAAGPPTAPPAGAPHRRPAYALLGLGDDNYTKFMQAPRDLSARLDALCMRPLLPRCEANEVLGLEEQVAAWQARLWPALEAEAEQAEAAGGMPPSTPALPALLPLPAPASVELEWLDAAQAAQAAAAGGSLGAIDRDGSCAAHPHAASIASARLLTSPDSDRVVMQLSLRLGDGACDALAHWSPGDTLHVHPRNDDADVTALLACLPAAAGDPDASCRVRPLTAAAETEWSRGAGLVTTAREVLASRRDIAAPPSRALLRSLAEHCVAGAAGERARARLLALAAPEGRAAYNSEIRDACITPAQLLLQLGGACVPPLGALLGALPPLRPRPYSVCCAPEASPAGPSVTFSLVCLAATTPPRLGVATGYMHSLATAAAAAAAAGAAPPEQRLLVHIAPGQAAFRPPADPDVAWIMIGQGTGVAPFVGFLQRRAAAARAAGARHRAPAWLFFGCRGPQEDFLFRAELEGWLADGTLDELEVAFSRAGPPGLPPTYVQHRVDARAEQLAALLAGPGAHAAVFVCGDGARMAKGVHDALAQALAAHAAPPDASTAELRLAWAEAWLAEMRADGRYVRDVWSAADDEDGKDDMARSAA
jgi:NADPH-ferrihemoprotein reductase